MATPQSILTSNSCVPCPGMSLADVLEINILQNILTSLGASMTQAQIMAEVPCYICQGISLAEAIKLVLLNAVSASAGGGGATGNLSGAGSPVGVVTPAVLNQFYRDTTGNALWQSTGLTSADWTQWI